MIEYKKLVRAVRRRIMLIVFVILVLVIVLMPELFSDQ